MNTENMKCKATKEGKIVWGTDEFWSKWTKLVDAGYLTAKGYGRGTYGAWDIRLTDKGKNELL